MIEGYKKLLNDLRLHERFKEAYKIEYEYNQKLFHDHFGTSRAIKSLDRVVADLRYYENLIYIEDENIKNLEANIKEIDSIMDNSNITVKVAQLRAKGFTQMEVAELVERSPRQVQRIEAKISNE